MTSIEIPEPIDYKTAFELKKQFAASLGWSPNDVMKIEFTASFIRVTARNRQVYTMSTNNLGTTGWVPKSVSYGHAQNII
jgi:hypothetical protein